MNLIKAQPPHVFPVLITYKQIAGFLFPAVYCADISRGAENDVAVGQVTALKISMTKAKGDLPDFPAFSIHFKKMVIMIAITFLPGKKNLLAVKRYIRIADHPVRAGKQGFQSGRVVVVDGEKAKLAARIPGAPFIAGVCVGESFGICVMLTALAGVFDENNLSDG